MNEQDVNIRYFFPFTSIFRWISLLEVILIILLFLIGFQRTITFSVLIIVHVLFYGLAIFFLSIGVIRFQSFNFVNMNDVNKKMVTILIAYIISGIISILVFTQVIPHLTASLEDKEGYFVQANVALQLIIILLTATVIVYFYARELDTWGLSTLNQRFPLKKASAIQFFAGISWYIARFLIYDTAIFNNNQTVPYDPSVRLLHALGAFLFIIIGIIVLFISLLYIFKSFKLKSPIYN